MQTNRKTWSQGHKLRMGTQGATLRIDVYFTIHIAPFQGFGVDLVTVAKINETFKHRLAPTQNKGKMTVVVLKRLEIAGRITQAGEKLPQSMNVKRSIQKITGRIRSEEHTSELQSRPQLVCRLLLEKKKNRKLKLRSRMKIREGKLQGFKRQAAVCISNVKEKDPGTLQYD